MENRKRNIRLRFWVTPEELEVIQQKQKLSHITNRGAFFRKMIMEGRILVLEIPELRQASSMLAHCSGNLNQIAKRVNATGRYYEGELAEVKQILNQAETDLRRLIEKLCEI